MKPVFRRTERFTTPLKLSAVAVAAILAHHRRNALSQS